MDPTTSGAGPLIPIIQPAPTPREITGKIIQLVAWQKVLIALTDIGDIWLLHGFDSVGSGTSHVPIEWRKLGVELPQASPVVQTTW